VVSLKARTIKAKIVKKKKKQRSLC